MNVFEMLRNGDLKVGSWLPEGRVDGAVVERFEITDQAADAYNLGLAINGRVHRSVEPGEYTRLGTDGVLQMSDTRAEIGDHIGFIRLASLRSSPTTILVNGLGLGLVAKALLDMDHVERVDVVEIDERVIALVEPHLRTATGAGDDRLVVHHDDALEIEWPPRTRWTLAWHDIWPTICGDNRESMTRLHRRYGGRVQHQDSWAREEVDRLNSGGYR